MTALKTTKAQRDAHMAWKYRARALHFPETEGGLCKVVLNIDDLVHDAELAVTLEETVASLAGMLNEAHNENKTLVLLLREFVGCSLSQLGSVRMADVRERAIDLLERKHAEGTKP